MARRKHPERSVPGAGLRGARLFGVAYGHVGWAILWSLGLVALYALGAGPIVFLAAGALLVVTCLSYAELVSALPAAGGAAGFGSRALNQLVGFGAGWALLLDKIILVALSAFFVPRYLAVFWPTLGGRPYDVIAGALTLVFLVVLGAVGLRSPGWIVGVPAILALVAEAFLIVLGLVLTFSPKVLVDQIDFGVAPTWAHLFYAIPIAVAGFAGIDAISSMADDVAQPQTRVPAVLNRSLPLAAVVGILLSLVAASAMPVSSNIVPVDTATGRTVPVVVLPAAAGNGYVLAGDSGTVVVLPVEKHGTSYVIPAQRPTGPVFEQAGKSMTRIYGTPVGGAYIDDPLVGIVAALPERAAWLKDVLRPLVAALAAAVLLAAAFLTLSSSSRLLYSLARERQLPALFGRVYATSMRPYVSIILCGVAAIALVLPGRALLLGELLGFGFALTIVVVNLAAVALRYREPGLARPFRMPGNIRVRGGSLPVAAVVGAVGGLAVWAAMIATHPVGRWVGLAWMAAGLLVYWAYRRAAGYPLLQPATGGVRLPRAAAVDIVYDQILVPVIGTRLTDEMLVLACQLATEKASSVDALNVLEVPLDQPLDAALDLERRRARKIVELATATAGEFGVEARGHVVAARSAGKAIVDVATQRKSEVIFLGAPRKRRTQDRIFGDTVSYVLRHAPCEVIVNLVPSGYPLGGSADEVLLSLTSDPGGDNASDTPERK